MTDQQLPDYGLDICTGYRGHRGCGRTIRWTATGKARLPVDPDPNPAGNVAAYLTDTNVWRSRVLHKGEQPTTLEHRFMPHMATCGRDPADHPTEPPPATPATYPRPYRPLGLPFLGDSA